MNNEEITKKVQAIFPDAVLEEGNQFLNITVPADQLFTLAKSLKEDPETNFDFLVSLSAVDWVSHFMVVYHMRSTTQSHNLVLKAKIDDREDPKVDTVSTLWETANFHEREAYDLMGIKFNNHPDLRRIFLEDNWEGYPLRKDYKDDVNMVFL